jgi:thiamine kinase-like enzyme
MFVREAKLYYERLNEFDPFKAEAMMTFLHADKDGGNLLDIDEI